MLSQDRTGGSSEASREEGPQADLPSLTPSLLNTSASGKVAAVPWEDSEGKGPWPKSWPFQVWHKRLDFGFSCDATSKMLSSLKILDVVCSGLHRKNWKGRLDIQDTAGPFRTETQGHIWVDCPSLEQGPRGGLGLPSDLEEEAFAPWRTLNSKLKKMMRWPESVVHLMYKIWCRSFWTMSTSPSCLSVWLSARFHVLLSWPQLVFKLDCFKKKSKEDGSRY